MQLQFGWLRRISWREQCRVLRKSPQLLDLAVILVFSMRREVVPPLEVTAPQNAAARAGRPPDAVRQPHVEDNCAAKTTKHTVSAQH